MQYTYSIPTKQILWNRDFINLSLSNLLLFMAFEMLMPTLPLFIVNNGGTDSEVGFIMGSFTFSAVCIRLFIGTISKAMNKKTLLIMGVTFCMLATGLYFYATSTIFTFGIRLLHGLGFGVATTLYATFASAFIPIHRRGEGLGYFGAGETLGLSIGPFLGIWLMHQHGINSVFFTGTFILLLAVFITFGVSRPIIPESKKTLSKPVLQEQHAVIDKFIEKRVLLQSSLAFLLGASNAGILSFIVLYAKAASIPNIAYFFFVDALAGLLTRFVAGKIFDKRGPGILIGASAICCIIGTIVLATTSTTLPLLISATFYGTGMGMAFPALQAWCINVVPANRREHAMSTFFNFFDLGIGLGAILLGIVATMTNYKTMYLLSTLLFVPYLFIYYGFAKKTNNSIE